ncbi:TIGR02444 family protein [Aliivibrio finisterrensis]|uniref:TIGR02444 family protein n=1 Tax=Aliivibrio finisterrensis TaxID=511998 RepID=A0A4Q5KD98_9GAMM|nr:TIGR02444 family protein [Aliivibrio finisterrensis]RYU44006.1 TIGR02444 family protein [Aliivibrio finisterrensis]
MPLSYNTSISTSQKALLTSEAFWSFSLSHYKKQGVQQAALELQDKHHGNVNLALLLTWLDSFNIYFSPSHFSCLEVSLSQSDELLQTYRQLRKKIKKAQEPTLYQDALRFELQIEKQQQNDLITALLRIPLQVKTTEKSPSLLSDYCSRLNASSLLLSLEFTSRLGN